MWARLLLLLFVSQQCLCTSDLINDTSSEYWYGPSIFDHWLNYSATIFDHFLDYSAEDQSFVVQVEDSPLTEPNLALNGITSQSSTYDKLGASANAIDGTSNTNYLKGSCSHTDLDIEPWWMVDLQGVYEVSSVSITNRGDCCNDRLGGAEVRIGVSPQDGGTHNHRFFPDTGVLPSTVTVGHSSSWWLLAPTSATPGSQRCGKINSLGLGETVHLNCSGLLGRYVTVTIPGKAAYLTLCQVKVHGVPGPENATDVQEPAEETQDPDSQSHVEELKNILKNSNAAPNVAMAGQAYQSSTLESAVAEKAIDGSLDRTKGRTQCAQTEVQMEPWWTVDLMSSFKVFSVALTVPSDSSEDQMAGAQIRVGNSASGRAKNPSCGSVISMTPGDTLSFNCGEMVGRYVTVFIPGLEKSLSLCEVQVFGIPESAPSGDGNKNIDPAIAANGSSNLALNGIASQSSNLRFVDDSSKAIDGSLSSNFMKGSCSHTQQQSEPWWMVDLKVIAKVHSVALTNREDCCRERINGAEIHIGNSRKDGGRHNPRCGTVFRMGYGETLSFSCHGMEGQYVSVVIPNHEGYLTLCEVQVFGVPMYGATLPPTDELSFKPTMTAETTTEVPATPESPSQRGLYGRSLVFPAESTDSYVILTPEKKMADKFLRAFTMCMRISTPLPQGREIILFSYYTDFFDALNLWREKDGTLGLYMSGPMVNFRIPRLRRPWKHLCLSWESSTGNTRAYINGHISKSRKYNKGSRLIPGGIFMLGQDQDSLGGDFEAEQSFVGKIRDVYMWSRKLHKGIVARVFRGRKIPEADIFDWRSLQYEIRGNVTIQGKWRPSTKGE